MDYVEFAPLPACVNWLQCQWRWTDHSPLDRVQTIYPDGRCEIILHLAEPLQSRGLSGVWETQARRLFSGQQREPVQLRPTGPIDCIGLRLRPAASLLIGGGRLPGLRDRIVALAELQPGLDGLLAHADAALSNPQELQSRLSPCFDLDPQQAAMHAVMARIDAADGRVALAELAREAGVSARTLQQRFLQQVGMTLQEYRRVLRLQATLRLLDGDEQNLAEIAAGAGFSDQSHATRELSRLTGLTPARLLKALRADREDEDTRRLAAAFVRGHA